MNRYCLWFHVKDESVYNYFIICLGKAQRRLPLKKLKTESSRCRRLFLSAQHYPTQQNKTGLKYVSANGVIFRLCLLSSKSTKQVLLQILNCWVIV